MEEQRLIPNVIFDFDKDGKNEYFTCPICGQVIMMDWDRENHCVIYPPECECGTKLKWSKKLTNLMSNSDKYLTDDKTTLKTAHSNPKTAHSTAHLYIKTGYFTKRKGTINGNSNN